MKKVKALIFAVATLSTILFVQAPTASAWAPYCQYGCTSGYYSDCIGGPYLTTNLQHGYKNSAGIVEFHWYTLSQATTASYCIHWNLMNPNVGLHSEYISGHVSACKVSDGSVCPY